MRHVAPQNPNYAAQVIRVRALIDIPRADRLKTVASHGMQAVVDLNTHEGDLCVLFPTECQISEEYARKNNQHRHSELNDDKDVVGYLEDNRRVRAITLRGARSDALLMPLQSLVYTGVKLDDLNEGDTFDVLNGHEICRKYTRPVRHHEPRVRQRRDEGERVDARVFPEQHHVPNYFRIAEELDLNAEVVVTQKLHGTNIRVGYVPVHRGWKWYERLAARFGVRVQDAYYQHVYGSHHVVKSTDAPHQHYYGEDIWTREGSRIRDVIPQNWVVYGELIGWVGHTSPIQRAYTYNVPDGEAHLYVYRVAVTNSQGVTVDLHWDAVKEWCNGVGLRHVPELWRGTLRDTPFQHWIDQREYGAHTVPLCDESPCQEGVVIRIEGLEPLIVKAKSPLFLQHETKMLDAGEPEDVADDNA